MIAVLFFFVLGGAIATPSIAPYRRGRPTDFALGCPHDTLLFGFGLGGSALVHLTIWKRRRAPMSWASDGDDARNNIARGC